MHVMESEMEKNLENEMQTGVINWLIHGDRVQGLGLS